MLYDTGGIQGQVTTQVQQNVERSARGKERVYFNKSNDFFDKCPPHYKFTK